MFILIPCKPCKKLSIVDRLYLTASELTCYIYKLFLMESTVYNMATEKKDYT